MNFVDLDVSWLPRADRGHWKVVQGGLRPSSGILNRVAGAFRGPSPADGEPTASSVKTTDQRPPNKRSRTELRVNDASAPVPWPRGETGETHRA